MINVDDRLLTQLDEKEMWLLMHIVKRLGADGTCWPSNETLLNDTGWKDIRTLRRVKSQLEDKGMMRQDARYNDKNEQRSNTYKVLTDLIGVYKTANTLQTGGAKNAQATGVQKMHSPGVQKMQGAGVQKMHHEVLSNEVLSNEVLISPKGESASAPNQNFTPKNQNEKRKKVAPKKEKAAGLPFLMWEVWAERHERLHREKPTQDAKFFKHLKDLAGKLAARIEAQGAEVNDAAICNNFGLFLDMLIQKGDAWYHTNFTPDIFNGKFLNIIQLLKQQHNEEQQLADKYARVIASFAE